MKTFTPAEFNMLAAFYQTSTNCCGRCCEEENMSYMNANDLKEELGLSKQTIKGLMLSLSDKAAISDSESSARGAKINDWVINDWVCVEMGEELENHLVVSGYVDEVNIDSVITLKEICESAGGIATVSARRKLRRSTQIKNTEFWVWERTDMETIELIISIIK